MIYNASARKSSEYLLTWMNNFGGHAEVNRIGVGGLHEIEEARGENVSILVSVSPIRGATDHKTHG